jgi:uncharacterized delta-60 repeat protein
MYRRQIKRFAEKPTWQKRPARTAATFVLAILAGSLLTFHFDGITAAYALSTWAMKLGGPGAEDMFRGISEASDGGYIFVGETDSFGAGSNDAWLLRLSEEGEVEWQRTYGGGSGDTGRVVRTTPDGGYIVAGQTHSFSSGSSDFWLIKFGSDDNIEWQRAYGGPRSDIAHALDLTSDGGYVVAGFTTSFGASSKDYFVIKLDEDGVVEWQKRYGASGEDVVRVVKQTSDGNYLVAGFTHSFGQAGDIMILMLDESGNLEWQKRYGGAKFEEPGAIFEVSDGYVVLEQTASFSGGTDGWIFKIDADGNILSQKRYNGNGFDELSAVRQTPDGGFIVVGETRSFGLTSEDFWVLKFDSSANLEWQKRYGGDDIDEAEAIALTPEGGYIIAGITRSFDSAGRDIWILRLDSEGNISQCSPEVHAGIATNAATKDTTATPVVAIITVANTTVSVKNTNAKIETTDALISMQCDPSMVNSPPEADNDSYSTDKNQDLNVAAPGVLENDDDDDAGDLLTASLVSGPHHGSLNLDENGGFLYSPDTGYTGSDSFTYRASDGTDQSNVATVTIQINDLNNAPVADDQIISTDENTPLDVTLTGSDEDGSGSLTFLLASLPDNGALTAAGTGLPDLTYVPDEGFTGTDSFTFIIVDTTGARSNTATVTIEVNSSPPPA